MTGNAGALTWTIDPERTLAVGDAPAEWCYRVKYRRESSSRTPATRWRAFLLLGVDDPTEEMIVRAIEAHEAESATATSSSRPTPPAAA